MVFVLTQSPMVTGRGLWDQIGLRRCAPVVVAGSGYPPGLRLLTHGAYPTLLAILGATEQPRGACSDNRWLASRRLPGWRNWQTRMVEGHVPARACWFDSSPGQCTLLN